jgi:hypothetical protein
MRRMEPAGMSFLRAVAGYKMANRKHGKDELGITDMNTITKISKGVPRIFEMKTESRNCSNNVNRKI